MTLQSQRSEVFAVRVCFLCVLRQSWCIFQRSAHLLQSSWEKCCKYVCVVWHTGQMTEQTEKIEWIQRRALRVIYPEKSYTEALQCTGLKTLQAHRESMAKPSVVRSSLPTTSCTAHIQNDRETSDAFPVTSAVKQGHALTLTLFSIIFSAMLTDALCDSEERILIGYRTDWKLLNQHRLQAVTKAKAVTIRDSLFANNCALNVTTEQRCKPAQTSSLGLVITSVSPSAQRKMKSCTSSVLESPTQNQMSE